MGLFMPFEASAVIFVSCWHVKTFDESYWDSDWIKWDIKFSPKKWKIEGIKCPDFLVTLIISL